MVGVVMHFDYSQYSSSCFSTPAFMVLWSFPTLIFVIYKIIKFRKSEDKPKEATVIFIMLLSSCMFIVTNIGVLLYGGYHLIFEGEQSAVEMYGYIEESERIDDFFFPLVKQLEYDYEETNGVKYIINGKKCTAMRQGDFKEGDYVFVRYLPKSSYVLYIEHQEKTADGSLPSDEP